MATLNSVIRDVRNERQRNVVDLLLCLETQDPVKIEVVPKDLLRRMESFKTAFQTTKISNQEAIEAVKVLCVDLGNYSRNRARYQNDRSKGLHYNTSKAKAKKQKKPSTSTEKPAS